MRATKQSRKSKSLVGTSFKRNYVMILYICNYFVLLILILLLSQWTKPQTLSSIQQTNTPRLFLTKSLGK